MTIPCDQTQLPSTDTHYNSALPHALHSVRAVTRTGQFHTFQDRLSNRMLRGALQYMYLLSLCIALPFFCFTTRLVAEAWLQREEDTMPKFFLVWIYDGYITSHFAWYLKLGSPLRWTTCLWVRREVGHFGLSLFCRWFFSEVYGPYTHRKVELRQRETCKSADSEIFPESQYVNACPSATLVKAGWCLWIRAQRVSLAGRQVSRCLSRLPDLTLLLFIAVSSCISP